MRGCLTDQSGDLDRGFATAVEVAIARRQGGVPQVEGLPVLLETPFVQRRSVEPRLARFGWTRAEVDLGPPGTRGLQLKSHLLSRVWPIREMIDAGAQVV